MSRLGAFFSGRLNRQFLHIRHIKHLRHLLRSLSDAVTGYELNQIQTVTIATLAADPRPAPVKVIKAKTILAPTFRAGDRARRFQVHQCAASGE